MEHFIAPEGAELIDVPFVCTEDWDGDNFMGYPERKGWAWDELMGYQNFGNRSREDVEAFFQTWLYFGSLISLFGLFGIEVKTRDFVRETEQGEKFITTKLLPVFIQDWVNREGVPDEHNSALAPAPDSELLDKSDRPYRGNMVHMILTRMLMFVDKYCNSKAQEDAKIFGTELDFWPMSPKVAMSVMAIGFPLSHVLFNLYRYEVPRWGSSPFLNERLKKAGWCVRDIPFHLPGTSMIDCDYYFGSYPSPRRNLNHMKCTKAVCCAINVPAGTYQTKHVAGGCRPGCRHVPVPKKDVLEIVEGGHIPIVSWREGKLSVTKYDDQPMTKYVAISHVWSDGLGNEEENSLPVCQLSRLQNMVDRLYAEEHDSGEAPPRTPSLSSAGNENERESDGEARVGSVDIQVGFWMDTLCVPVGSDYDDYRKAAIRKMGSIYKSAHRVLVLDSLVFEIPHSADIIDKYTCLYLSNWQRRLWTLQEGLFAQKLFFQFGDKALTIDDMHPEVKGHSCRSIPHFYSSVVSSFSAEFSMLYMHWSKFQPTVSDHFEMFTDKVCSRTTSKQEDESICLSTIMGIDPGPLFKCGDGKRMECFYEKVGRFKPQIIFNDFPRLPTRGFRWAPSSFVGQSYKLFPELFKYLSTPDTTLHSEGGLRVTFPGIKLGTVGPYLGTKILVVPRKEPWFWYEVWLRPDHEGKYPTWDSGSQYMIVSEEPLSERGPASEAILGIVDGEEKNKRILIQHVCRARVEIPDQEDLENIKKLSRRYLKGKAQFTGEEQGFDGRYPVYADLLKKKQKWRIL